MSFLKELREHAPGKVDEEKLVNNEKIEDQETSNDANSVNQDNQVLNVDGNDNNNLDKGNDNDDTDDVEKLEGVGKLIELRQIVENDNSLEANDPIVQFYLTLLKDKYNIDLESDSSDTNEGLLSRIKKKIGSILGSIKKWSAETLDKIRGIDDIPAILSHLKSLDKDGQAKFEEKLAEATSVFLDNGKVVLPSVSVSKLREFETKIVKAFSASVKNIAKGVESEEDTLRAVKDLSDALAKEKLNLPGLQIDSVDDGYHVKYHVEWRKQKLNFSAKTQDVIKYLEQVEKDWASFRKLVGAYDNTWAEIVKETSKINESGNAYQKDAVSGVYFNLFRACNASYEAFKYPRKDILSVLSAVKTACALKK